MQNLSNIFFNAHHAPIGSFATLTLGERGARGGMGLELGRPADQDIYVALEREDGSFDALPFYSGCEGEGGRSRGDSEERARYEVSGAAPADARDATAMLRRIADCDIARDFHVATDTWSAGALSFRVVSPVLSVPDPATASEDELQLALVPAILTVLTVDNSRGRAARRAIFGFSGSGGHDVSGMRRLDDSLPGGLVGIGQGATTAIVCEGDGVISAQGFSVDDILREKITDNLAFGLGSAALLIATVPAGQTRSFTFAVCFYKTGVATTGLDTRYFYTRFWQRIEDVAQYALAHRETLLAAASRADAWLADAPLSSDQRFMLTHGIRSYYGSTQLLARQPDGAPIWVVGEGEYRMMNTLDLSADQVYFEMAMNPWTVRNVLDLFAERYAYTDRVSFPGDPDRTFEGGVSFTHDMGVANVFSGSGRSSYEKAGLTGCFSHMTQEELVNWLCCALVYGRSDKRWLQSRRDLLERCFQSMLQRDHPDPAKRNGVMSLDSNRCAGGAEITTYDSLDTSLGQARGNVYLAGKCWATYLGLERAFRELGADALAGEAAAQAGRCARTLCGARDRDQGAALPAVIGEDVPARIIPAIEGLVYLEFFGRSDVLDSLEHAPYIAALREHLAAVLKKGVCLFASGAWKLSSTSDNSWLSKIYVCQYIARRVLGIDGRAVTEDADRAHVAWLLDPRNTYWCWSDQIVAGVAEGSKYYPRGVTACLWLREHGHAASPESA